jgi:hypothetical protein
VPPAADLGSVACDTPRQAGAADLPAYHVPALDAFLAACQPMTAALTLDIALGATEVPRDRGGISYKE